VTPDLDQSLSMKAQLDDKVTPELQKIERHARTTREAISQMVEEVQSGEGKLGSSASKMSSDVRESTATLKKELDEVSDSFRETSDNATQSSQKIGQAIEDSMYSQGASSKMNELDDDLGRLDRTFKGMASTQKSVSGKARSISAVAHDSLNTKVIPAFQNLHATLEDYPDTLEDINKMEEERMKMLEEGGGVMDRMKGRVEGVKTAVDEIQLGMMDAASVMSAGTLGVIGASVQEKQTSASQIQGSDIWESMPALLQDVSTQARTTMDNVMPIMEAMMELRSTPKDVMAPIVAEIYDIHKATGIAGESIVELRDQFTRLGGATPEEFTKLMDEAAFMAHETGMGMEEMFGVLQSSGDQIIMFARDARTAYVESAMAAAATEKTMGLDTGTAAGMLQSLYDSPEMVAKIQGLLAAGGSDASLAAGGSDASLRDIMQDGDQDRLLAEVSKASQNVYEGYDMKDSQDRRALSLQTDGFVTADMLTRFREGVTETGEGKDIEDIKAAMLTDAQGTIKEDAGMIRTTTAERTEQMMGAFQKGLIIPAEKTIDSFSKVVEGFGFAVGEMSDFFIEKDRESGGQWSTLVAGAVAGEAAVTAQKAVGGAIGKLDVPFADQFGDLIAGGMIEHGAVRAGVMAFTAGRQNISIEELVNDPEKLEELRAQLREEGHSEEEIAAIEQKVVREAQDEMGVLDTTVMGGESLIDNATAGAGKLWDWAASKMPWAGDEQTTPQDLVDQPSVELTETSSGHPFEDLDMSDAVQRRSFEQMSGGDAENYDSFMEQIKSGSGFNLALQNMSLPSVGTPDFSDQQDAMTSSASAAGETINDMVNILDKADPNSEKQTGLQTEMTGFLGQISETLTKIANAPVPSLWGQPKYTDDGEAYRTKDSGR